MEVGKEGSLVWLQRKNGKWWPGKVLRLDEISASDRSSFASTSRAPIMLLGRKNGSVEWHKLENSRHMKSFRCGDFDDFIRKAESSQVSPCIQNVKYAHREDAILHAIQLEKQEVGMRLKRPGKVQQGAICGAKRSRCVHFPVESFHHAEHSRHSQPVLSSSITAIDDYYIKTIVAENNPSEATISDFSGGGIQDSEGIMQPTGMKKQNSGENSNLENGSGTPMVMTNGKNSVTSRNRRHNIRDLLMVSAAYQEKRGCWNGYKSGEASSLEVNKLSYSSCEGSHLEDSDSLSFGMETMLMDVEVTVLANHRREDVPLVSLMGRLNGKAVIGHPIHIEALDDSSDLSLVRNGKFHHRSENDDNRMDQLVWRTSKRTPVCYISNVHSSPSKGEETDCRNPDGSSLEQESVLLQQRRPSGSYG